MKLDFDSGSGFFLSSVKISEEVALLPVCGADAVVEFNLKDQTHKIHKVFNHGKGFSAIGYDGKIVLLIAQNANYPLRINKSTQLASIDTSLAKLWEGKGRVGDQVASSGFTLSKLVGNTLCAYSATAEKFVRFNLEFDMVEEIEVLVSEQDADKILTLYSHAFDGAFGDENRHYEIEGNLRFSLHDFLIWIDTTGKIASSSSPAIEPAISAGEKIYTSCKNEALG